MNPSIFASRNGDGRVQTVLNIHANVLLQASVSQAKRLPVTSYRNSSLWRVMNSLSSYSGLIVNCTYIYVKK